MTWIYCSESPISIRRRAKVWRLYIICNRFRVWERRCTAISQQTLNMWMSNAIPVTQKKYKNDFPQKTPTRKAISMVLPINLKKSPHSMRSLIDCLCIGERAFTVEKLGKIIILTRALRRAGLRLHRFLSLHNVIVVFKKIVVMFN